jgi:hypothetical protein
MFNFGFSVYGQNGLGKITVLCNQSSELFHLPNLKLDPIKYLPHFLFPLATGNHILPVLRNMATLDT